MQPVLDNTCLADRRFSCAGKPALTRPRARPNAPPVGAKKKTAEEQRAREEARRLLRDGLEEPEAAVEHTPSSIPTSQHTKPARRQQAMASKKEASANLAKGRAVVALTRQGMTKEDARRTLGLDAPAASKAPADKPARRKVHQTGETVLPTPTGGGIMSGHAGTLRAYVHAHTILQYDERELGAILEGFIRAIREPTGPDTSSMFPPPMPAEAMVQWRELAQERELGRQLFKHIGKALVHFNLAQEEWRSAFDRVMREMYPDGRVVPFEQAPAASSGTARGTWLSPLAIPSVVTDIFNRVRDDKSVHKGVDLRAPVGTLVVAPRRGRIAKVGFDEEGGGGRFLHLVIERPDGSIPKDEMGRDSGWRMSFAHLSDVIVKEGDTVEAGQTIARSGDTGYRQTGPHLHMSLQWFIDNNLINERIFVDPLAVIPEDVIKGVASPQPVQSSAPRVAPAIIESQPGAQSGQSVSVSIGGDGNLVFNSNGTAVQVSPKVPIALPIPFTGGGADDMLIGKATDFFGPGAAPPVRPMTPAGSAALMTSNGSNGAVLMGIPEQLLSMGGKVLEGVGNFAGKAFQVLTSPQGLRTAGTVLGGATGLLGAASSAAGTVVPSVGPMLVGWIPYVGPALAAAAEVAGPVLSAAGPMLGGVGGAISGASNAVPDFLAPPPPSDTGQLLSTLSTTPTSFDLEFFGLKPTGKSLMPV